MHCVLCTYHNSHSYNISHSHAWARDIMRRALSNQTYWLSMCVKSVKRDLDTWDKPLGMGPTFTHLLSMCVRSVKITCVKRDLDSTTKWILLDFRQNSLTKPLQHTAMHCNALQCTAMHCNTLQHTATHGNTLQHTATHGNTLQHTATHCYTLLHTATHCNTLQHTATTWYQTRLSYCQ